MRLIVWGMCLSIGTAPCCTRAAQSRDAAVPRDRVVPVAIASHIDASIIEPRLAPQPVAHPPATHVTARITERGLCGMLAHPDATGHFLARRDLVTAVVDGADLLAVVDRSAAGGLRPDDVPNDLIDLRTGAPATPEHCEPPGGQCLRREAADALHGMLAAMRTAGQEGYLHSAFRAYPAQCGVFAKWSRQSTQGFCAATEQSALAGHSQHQLGTALDLFTQAWARGGPVFRNGFGCSQGGRWIAEHSWEYGFVLPYTLAPDFRSRTNPCAPRSDVRVTIDPRTGYRFEPWHVRYIGRENAARFHADWLASGPGTSAEIAVDPWLRRRAGRDDDGPLPVCDHCACGACTTLAREGDTAPCSHESLQLQDDGAPVASTAAPEIVAVRVARRVGTRDAFNVDVQVDAPAHTVTQSPTFSIASPPYERAADYRGLVGIDGGLAHAYVDLAGAWRLVVRPRELQGAWPWRASLADPVASLWNGANVRLPAMTGRHWSRVAIVPPAGTRTLRIALMHDGSIIGERETELPP